MSSEEFSMLTSALTSVVDPDGDQASCMWSVEIFCDHAHIGLGGTGRCCCHTFIAYYFGEIQ